MMPLYPHIMSLYFTHNVTISTPDVTISTHNVTISTHNVTIFHSPMGAMLRPFLESLNVNPRVNDESDADSGYYYD